jgi:uncharacterized membrane protein
MTIGPLEIVVIGFEGNNFRGEIAPELERLQREGTIRVIDLIFVAKNASGEIIATEIEELDAAYGARYGSIAADLRGVLTEEDVANVALELSPNTAALIALFEHAWAVGFKEAAQRAGGVLLGSERVSPEVINELAVELEAALAP